MPSIAAITTQNIHAWSKRPTLKFMPMIPASTVAGRRIDRGQREHLHDVVRPLADSGDEEVERAEGRLLRFAGGVQCLGQATLEGGEPLRRVLGRERIEFGMCQRDNDFAVRGECSSQRPDRAAELDQPG